MKRCSSCGEMKPLGEYSPQKHTPDKLAYKCKPCNSKAARAWNLANRERANATCLRYQARSGQHKKWAAANREYLNAYGRAWRKKNKTLHSIRHIHGQTKPKWATNFFMREAYRLAGLRTKATGIKWEVDHIVPLNHRLVSGLHVEANLRVITRFDNRSKGNRRWPDMP